MFFDILENVKHRCSITSLVRIKLFSLKKKKSKIKKKKIAEIFSSRVGGHFSLSHIFLLRGSFFSLSHFIYFLKTSFFVFHLFSKVTKIIFFKVTLKSITLKRNDNMFLFYILVSTL